MPTPTVPLAIAAAAVVLASAACSSPGDDATVLTVFAASSLTEPFEEIAEQFEADHAGVEVRLSLAGSSDLLTQLRGGAPADVFAAADEATMSAADGDGLVATPQLFATNTLTIAVPRGNPEGIERLLDLDDTDLRVVVCAPQVPCGASATAVEEAAGIDLRPASEEPNVTDVLNKVATGEADAGLVYVTDIARADGAVEAVDFAESAKAVNAYPIAAVEGSEHGGLAQELVDLVLSRAGQDVLAEAGFGSP